MIVHLFCLKQPTIQHKKKQTQTRTTNTNRYSRQQQNKHTLARSWPPPARFYLQRLRVCVGRARSTLALSLASSVASRSGSGAHAQTLFIAEVHRKAPRCSSLAQNHALCFSQPAKKRKSKLWRRAKPKEQTRAWALLPRPRFPHPVSSNHAQHTRASARTLARAHARKTKANSVFWWWWWWLYV